jgi:ABC-type sugar transport system ATPase subunit
MLYLSEERKHHGIFPLLSLRENIGISILSLTKGALGISGGREREAVQKIIDDYGIRTSGMGKRISQLSGGNQQKAIIGRAMATRPRVLIFDEPTKGIDIRTKTEIYRIMKGLAEEGVGVILVSSELDELKKCASRIVTMHHGRITRRVRHHQHQQRNPRRRHLRHGGESPCKLVPRKPGPYRPGPGRSCRAARSPASSSRSP